MSNQELKEAIGAILTDAHSMGRMGYISLAASEDFPVLGPKMVAKIMELVEAYTNREVVMAIRSERAWAYKHLRNDGGNPRWVEVAKARLDRATLRGGK